MPKEKINEDIEDIEIEAKEFGYRRNLNNLVWKVSELRSTVLPIPKRGEVKLVPINLINYIFGVQQLVMLLKPYWDTNFTSNYNVMIKNGMSAPNLYLQIFGLIMELMERKNLLLEKEDTGEEW